jgi:hypothetical protein
MLADKGETSQKLKGFELGADDTYRAFGKEYSFSRFIKYAPFFAG